MAEAKTFDNAYQLRLAIDGLKRDKDRVETDVLRDLIDNEVERLEENYKGWISSLEQFNYQDFLDYMNKRKTVKEMQVHIRGVRRQCESGQYGITINKTIVEGKAVINGVDMNFEIEAPGLNLHSSQNETYDEAKKYVTKILE
jgi:hypothetical protein